MELAQLFDPTKAFANKSSFSGKKESYLDEFLPEPIISEENKARARRVLEQTAAPVEETIGATSPLLYQDNSDFYKQDTSEQIASDIKKTIKRIVVGGYATSPTYEKSLYDMVRTIPKLKGEKKNFYEKAFITYLNKGVKKGEAIVYAAQDCLESNYGTKTSGKNNFGGIKGKGTVKNTHEFRGGKKTTEQAEFRNFTSFGDYADYKIALLKKPRYNQV